MNVDPTNKGLDSFIDPLSRHTTPVLCEQVRLALKDYFSKLDGHEVSNLHALVLSEVERPLLQSVLEHCGFNQSKAAQMLGLSRSTLRKKITQLGLE